MTRFERVTARLVYEAMLVLLAAILGLAANTIWLAVTAGVGHSALTSLAVDGVSAVILVYFIRRLRAHLGGI